MIKLALDYTREVPNGFLGSYAVTCRGLVTAGPAAGVPYFAFRWAPPAGQLCVVRVLDLRLNTTTTGSNITEVGIFFGRSFTAPYTGGTAVSFTGDRQKKRTSYPTSLMSDMRYASAGVISAGTATLDPEPLFLSGSSNATTTGTPLDATSFSLGSDDPIIIANNEGLVLANVNALTSTVYRWQLRMEWIELAAGAV